MREKNLINHDWYFTKDFDGKIPNQIPEDAQKVTLPHTWNAEDGTDGGNDYYRGKCLYMRKLDLSSVKKNRKYYLEFKGVNSKAEVFFNGICVAEHRGGYSTFRADVTEHIRLENIIAVTVDNSHDDAVYPTMADFTFYGGIYRDVSLICVHTSHFELDCYGSDGIKVTPRIMSENRAEIDVEVFVTGAKDGLELSFCIMGKNGECVAKDEAKLPKNRLMFEIESPHMWQGTLDPYLYLARVSLLSADGEIIDEVQTRFGIRSFSVDSEQGFFLNGKPYPLHGVSRHQDRAGVGNALLPTHHEEDALLIRELGANAVRLAHYQHDSRFYDLCDEYGFVVWAEIPYISRHINSADGNATSQFKELIIQNYNHPSICFWGISNEITMSESDSEDLINLHTTLNKLAHELDPTRLTGVAAVSMCDTNHEYLKIPDVVGYNHYFGWYGGDTSMNGPWFDEFHAQNPRIPICVTEYGAEALNWHTSEPRQGDYTEEYQAYYHEELIKQLFSRKFIFATFVWNMFDFGADARAEGGENGQNHKGLVTFDRKYKKDAFYAYKAHLSDEPFVHIGGKRYIDRAESTTRVTVYSNQPEVELIVNGVSKCKKTAPDHFFRFEVPLEAQTRIEAVAGSCRDSAVFRRVDRFNEKYILKEKGAVLNWFDVTAPEGYFSLNDEIGEIIKTKEGNAWFSDFASHFSKKIDTPMPILDENMMKMLGGFTVLRFLNTVSAMAAPMSKEELLAINDRLNKIKKQ